MNAIFVIVVIISIITLSIRSPALVLTAMLDGAGEAINLTIKLISIYAVWLSVLKMVERTHLDKKLLGLFRPLIDRIFKGESEQAKSYIGMNIAANMLGMGGAATPLGIKAVNEMSKGREEREATKNMKLFLIINAVSVQLIPATIMALRARNNSQNPTDILIPTLITTITTTVVAVFLAFIMEKIKARKVICCKQHDITSL